MNLANKLTVTRVALIPFFVVALLTADRLPNHTWAAVGKWVALAIFVGATITDYYDGVVARSQNTITPFGQLFDPLADKLLTMAAFVAFVELRMPNGVVVMPAWTIILILGREFLVTGMRSLAVMQGYVMAADRWGKHKTAWQLAGIITILSFLALHRTALAAVPNASWMGHFETFMMIVRNATLFVVTTLTVVSGIVYVRNHRDLLRAHD